MTLDSFAPHLSHHSQSIFQEPISVFSEKSLSLPLQFDQDKPQHQLSQTNHHSIPRFPPHLEHISSFSSASPIGFRSSGIETSFSSVTPFPVPPIQAINCASRVDQLYQAKESDSRPAALPDNGNITENYNKNNRNKKNALKRNEKMQKRNEHRFDFASECSTPNSSMKPLKKRQNIAENRNNSWNIIPIATNPTYHSNSRAAVDSQSKKRRRIKNDEIKEEEKARETKEEREEEGKSDKIGSGTDATKSESEFPSSSNDRSPVSQLLATYSPPTTLDADISDRTNADKSNFSVQASNLKRKPVILLPPPSFEKLPPLNFAPSSSFVLSPSCESFGQSSCVFPFLQVQTLLDPWSSSAYLSYHLPASPSQDQFHTLSPSSSLFRTKEREIECIPNISLNDHTQFPTGESNSLSSSASSPPSLPCSSYSTLTAVVSSSSSASLSASIAPDHRRGLAIQIQLHLRAIWREKGSSHPVFQRSILTKNLLDNLITMDLDLNVDSFETDLIMNELFNQINQVDTAASAAIAAADAISFQAQQTATLLLHQQTHEDPPLLLL